MKRSLLKHESAINLTGPSGHIEAILAEPTQPKRPMLGIICHPHPLQGGTMHHKIVTTISRLFSELGLINLRFNFRGVEESAGCYGEALGEAEDLLVVMQWALKTYPNHALWLAGFSFGSYISAYIAARQPVQLLLSIAPPVNHFDFSSLTTISCPWIVVQGDQDEVVPATEVYAWVASLKRPPQLIPIPTATHFFHGHLPALKEKLTQQLSPYLLSCQTSSDL